MTNLRNTEKKGSENDKSKKMTCKDAYQYLVDTTVPSPEDIIIAIEEEIEGDRDDVKDTLSN